MMQAIDRGLLEQTARYIGPHSAAAKALACADEHNGPVAFWQHGATVIVEKIPLRADACRSAEVVS
jgi:hypothetical protein